MTFYFGKFIISEVNYPVYDKKLATIIFAFDEWQSYLVGAEHRIQDHKNLIYFNTNRTLTRRHAHWSSFLTDYDFEILFRPDIKHGKAKALSRRPDFALCPGEDAYSQQSHCLLRPDQYQMFATCLLHDDSLVNEIAKATITMSNTFANGIMACINDLSKGMEKLGP